MKKSLYQVLKFFVLILIAVGVAVGASLLGFNDKESKKVYAGVGDNVTGYAWSENIGWISFNNTNTSGGISYGVNITENASGVGVFSGYAWSENIGWISFNRVDTVAPPNNDVGLVHGALAFIDGGNKMQGWARAIVACDNNNDGDCIDAGLGEGVGAGMNSGGWDGWMRFNNGSTYGLTLVPQLGTSYFTGWAWGSDVLGWLSSNNRNCDTDNNGQSNGGAGCPVAGTVIPAYAANTTFELNQAPTSPSSASPATMSPKFCSSYDSSSKYLAFNWTFNDPNLNSSNQQSKYKIDVTYPGFSYSTGEINQSVANGGAGSGSVLLSNLGSWYGETITWTVTAWDNGIFPKSTSSSSTYVMPDREYPYVTFYSNPALDKIFAKQDVKLSPDQFFTTDKAKCYSSGNTAGACGSYSWSFSGTANPVPASSALKEPVINLGSGGSLSATLTMKDSANHSCSATRNIDIGLPLPEVKEKKQ